jgi:chromosome segregation ATPase
MKGRALVTALAAVLCGCTTVRPVAPPAAAEYREAQAEINQQQTELAVTGERLGEGSRDIIEGLEALETALAGPNYDQEKIEEQVKELRSTAEEHRAETERINRLLAEERETTRRQGEISDRREEAWQQAVSDRDAENAALRVENKKIAGQRSVLFVITISLAAAFILEPVPKLIDCALKRTVFDQALAVFQAKALQNCVF